MIRVGHVICDLAGGGAERLVLDLCRGAAPDIAPSVFTVHDGGALQGAFSAAGVRVCSLGRRRGTLGLRAALRLARALGDVDVVHTHLWAGDTWGRAAALTRPGLPVLVTEHNARPDAGAWRVAVCRALAARTDWTVAVGPPAREMAVRRGLVEERMEVIVNGVALDRFSAAPLPPEPASGEPFTLVGVGRLEHQKGFDVLVEAAAGLPVTVELVGAGSMGPDLRRLARRWGVRLRLSGWRGDPRGALARAHLVVAPSRFEGFGIAVVEALAMGRPVVTTPPLRPVVGDAAVVVPAEDPVALRSALHAVLMDPARRRRLSRAAPPQAARFDLQQTVRAYEVRYRELLAARR